MSNSRKYQDLVVGEKAKLHSSKSRRPDPQVDILADYLIVFINKSDTVFTRIRTKNSNATNWPNWYVMGTVGRTCSLASFEDCVKLQKWTPILNTACNSAAFDLQISTTPNGQGEYEYLEWTGLQPSCQYGGGIVGYEP